MLPVTSACSATTVRSESRFVSEAVAVPSGQVAATSRGGFEPLNGGLARDLGLSPAYIPELCDGQTIIVFKVCVRLACRSDQDVLGGKRRPKDTQRHDTDSAATAPARQCRAAARKRAHGTAAVDAGRGRRGVCMRVLRTTVDPSSHLRTNATLVRMEP